MRILALLSFLFLAACSTPGLDPNSQVVSVQSELPEPTATDMGRNLVAYRLGPTDVINVSVLNADELNREGQVDGAGMFTLPLVGTIQAGGLTPQEMSAVIADRLRGRYLKDPQVSVTLVEARSNTVTIDGAVTQPGVYPVVGEMTLQRAIATARGLNRIAKADRVVVFRTVGGERMAAMFDLNQVRAGQLEDPRIFGNDIIVVGESGVRRFLSEFGGVPILSRFVPAPIP
ncbi:polysaccharide biosynthesis/export family protein [Sphingomicrobium sp. XHP0239]|uniref:polysaccharide biosynthesis/export family protein n=1 Tax=Sphingomicrobium maritimum TaxID=3133972 RepID=UPI0031CC5951